MRGLENGDNYCESTSSNKSNVENQLWRDVVQADEETTNTSHSSNKILEKQSSNATKESSDCSSESISNDDQDKENESTNKVDESSSDILELDSEVEESACQLWDMTVERDVTLHLLKLDELDILQLSSQVLTHSKSPRLTVSIILHKL